jgi:predicted PurR-regulated permease PerM
MEWLKLIIDAQERGDLQTQIDAITKAHNAFVDSVTIVIVTFGIVLVVSFVQMLRHELLISRLKKQLQSKKSKEFEKQGYLV